MHMQYSYYYTRLHYSYRAMEEGISTQEARAPAVVR